MNVDEIINKENDLEKLNTRFNKVINKAKEQILGAIIIFSTFIILNFIILLFFIVLIIEIYGQILK